MRFFSLDYGATGYSSHIHQQLNTQNLFSIFFKGIVLWRHLAASRHIFLTCRRGLSERKGKEASGQSGVHTEFWTQLKNRAREWNNCALLSAALQYLKCREKTYLIYLVLVLMNRTEQIDILSVMRQRNGKHCV